MSHHYVPEQARGVRWDDPAFGIEWPRRRPRSSPSATGSTPTSGREARARHRRRPASSAATRCRCWPSAGYEVHATWSTAPGEEQPGVTWHRCDLLDRRRRALVAEVAPTHLLHFAWYAVPGKFWDAAGERCSGSRRASRLLRAFADAGGRRATLAGTLRRVRLVGRGVLSRARRRRSRPATYYGTCKHALRDGRRGPRRTARRRASPGGGSSSSTGRTSTRPARVLARRGRSCAASRRRRPRDRSVRDFLHVARRRGGVRGAARLRRRGRGQHRLGRGGRPCATSSPRSPRPPGGRTSCSGARCRSGPGTRPCSRPTSRRLRDEVGWTPGRAARGGHRATRWSGGRRTRVDAIPAPSAPRAGPARQPEAGGAAIRGGALRARRLRAAASLLALASAPLLSATSASSTSAATRSCSR